MTSQALALLELGVILFALGICGRVAGRFGMSPIPLYLLGGLAFGRGGYLQLEAATEFGHLASEIGVVLLLLLLGLEYTAPELMTGLRRSWAAGLVDLVANALPGAAVALILGWGVTGAVVLGGVTYISSSGIVAKVLDDLGRLGNRETPVVLSILVLEDLAMAVYLPILTMMLAGLSLLSGLMSLAVALATISVVLVVALRFGRVVSAVLDSADRGRDVERRGRGRRVPARHRDLGLHRARGGQTARAAARSVRRDLLRRLRAVHRSGRDRSEDRHQQHVRGGQGGQLVGHLAGRHGQPGDDDGELAARHQRGARPRATHPADPLPARRPPADAHLGARGDHRQRHRPAEHLSLIHI